MMNQTIEPASARPDSLLGVVLCGGQSSRMGADKSQLKHPTGMTYQEYACQRLQEICGDVVCVGGDHSCEGIVTLPDPVAFHGPAIGVATALQYAVRRRLAACVVTPVDLPSLQASDLRRLIAAWSDDPSTPACAFNDADQRLQPLVAVYPSHLVDEVLELTRTSHRSLYRWLSSIGSNEVSIHDVSLRNVNRPEDLV